MTPPSNRGQQPRRGGYQTETPSPEIPSPQVVHGNGELTQFIWQQLSEIQRSVASLGESSKQLNTSMEKLDARLDKLEEKLSGVTHKLYAAGVVLTLTITFGAWVFSEVWSIAKPILIEKVSASLEAPQKQADKESASKK